MEKRITTTVKLLLSKLEQFDLDKDPIQSLSIDPWGVYLHSTGVSEKIFPLSADVNQHIEQTNARWDFVKETLSSVEDQPVVLGFIKNRVSLTFHY